MNRTFFALLIMAVCVTAAGADEKAMLTRDEVAGLKKKLVAVAAAVGQPPAGYAKDDENFNLPTEAYTQKPSGKYNWVAPSMTSRFSGGGEKKAKKSQRQIQKEYEKKMAEAMAKGDYEALGTLGQEVQKQAGQAHLAEVEGRKDPIDMRVGLNTYQSQTIDPDAVVFEKPGVIALLVDTKEENRNRLLIFFDPVALKETKTLSRVDFKQPEGGVSKKTAVYNATVEFTGPAAEIKAWAAKINAGAVLGQIDSGR